MRSALAILIFLASTVPSGATGFAESLRGKLVKLDPASGELVPHEIPAVPKTEFFMIYFSGHWCAPCRKMTPAIVGFYNEIRKDHPGVELIFVSADRSEGAMRGYMKWAGMPWPALAWDQREAVEEIVRLRPSAVPYMALFDGEGQLIGASETGGFNFGIPKLLNGLQEKLGTEIYDVRERHGKKSPLVPIAYAAAAAIVVVLLIRKRIANRKRLAPPAVPDDREP